MSLTTEQMALLQTKLADDYVNHLPPLANQSESVAKQQTKNLSRAFAAFALANICEIDNATASASIVDDFDDFGIDGIFYKADSQTLYLIQAKLKAGAMFSQDEALKFCNGVKKVVAQDFSDFNQHVITRQQEIEDAVSNCEKIELIVAHTGSGIGVHALAAINELLSDENHGEERFQQALIDYDSARTITDLRQTAANPRIDARLVLQSWSSITEPKKTYFGAVPLKVLAELHKNYGKALYDKNIRNFLGHTTEVSKSIQQTLSVTPEDFFYLNNGVTALCQSIMPKDNKKSGKTLQVRGLSIINGAQTVSSAARYIKDNPNNDISNAVVLLTLIESDDAAGFSKKVTKSRNHQNPVLMANFAALDNRQEHLRCEAALLGISYSYKAEGPDGVNDPNAIRIDEAAYALALAQRDPRFAVWFKKEPKQLFDTEQYPYKQLFTDALQGCHLINAVKVYRYLDKRILDEVRHNTYTERLAYKHGCYGIIFVMMKSLRNAIFSHLLIDGEKLTTALGASFDDLRQIHWDHVKNSYHGPLAIFRNQTHALPLMSGVMAKHYGLNDDPALKPLLAKFVIDQQYPVALFDYLAQKAPQIGGLS
jgi:hypothetical protein